MHGDAKAQRRRLMTCLLLFVCKAAHKKYTMATFATVPMLDGTLSFLNTVIYMS